MYKIHTHRSSLLEPLLVIAMIKSSNWLLRKISNIFFIVDMCGVAAEQGTSDLAKGVNPCSNMGGIIYNFGEIYIPLAGCVARRFTPRLSRGVPGNVPTRKKF